MQPRIEKPSPGNKYYINTKDGGYNSAKGNPNRKNKELTSLPNCVAVYGWFNEIGEQGMKYLKIPYYPYAVIEAAKRQGLEITKEPTEGGIMVWTGGATGEGHVEGCAIVHDENTITSVGSEYYGRDWTVFKRKNTDGNWRSGCKWMNKSYIYQGCIKNPFMEEEMSYEQFKAYMDQYEKEKASEKADDWSKEAINMAIARGYMVGYPDGFHPQSNIRREEVAQISENLIARVKDFVKEYVKEVLGKK